MIQLFWLYHDTHITRSTGGDWRKPGRRKDRERKLGL